MLRKPETTRKPDDTPKHQPQSAEGRAPLKTAAAVGFACALLDGGCTGGTAQVRPTPAPIACPSDWQEAHQTLGIGYEENETVVLQGYEGENTERATVQEGPVTVVLDDSMGELPEGTLLYGALQLGEGRFYGTFTQAHIPGGSSYPVCLVIGRNAPTDGCPEGLGECPAPESRPGNVKTFTRFFVFHKGSRF
jgi:serine/threonine-protein kinase